MIKSVTYQGAHNFAANLYALEVRSRHIDQNAANGYYKGYGSELAATIVGNQVTIGTGAFIVQARINEVVSPETVDVQIINGRVGYIVARIETFHPSDENNCTFIAYTGTSLANIQLTQEDTFSAESETVNKVYELPIYSFTMASNQIQNLTKIIEVVGDYERLKVLVDSANTTADAANAKSDAANLTAAAAQTTANAASAKSDAANATAAAASNAADNAVATAQAAETTANQAKAHVEQQTDEMRQDIADFKESTNSDIVDFKETTNADIESFKLSTNADIAEFKTTTLEMVDEKHSEMSEEIDQLAEQIGERQGTTIRSDGVPLASLDLDNDFFIFDGGNA